MPTLTLNASQKTKHTPAGEIPVDWACVPLGDLCEIVGGIQKGKHRTPKDNPVRYLTVAHVQSNKLLLDDVRYFEVSPKEFERWRLQKYDLLIVEGNGNLDQVGRTSLFRGEIERCVHQNHVIRARPNIKLLEPEFINSFINSTKGCQLIKSVSFTSSGLHTLSVGRVRELPIPLPPLPEQKKIAAILCTWDRAIEAQQALIDAKTEQKNGLMQQLLNVAIDTTRSGHNRHRIGEVIERVTRKNTIEDKNVLTISARFGLVSQSEYFNKNVAGKDLSKYYLLKNGEFAYNRSSAKGYPYGAIKRLDTYETGIVSTLYLCFRIKDEKLTSSPYLCHYFEAGMLNQGLRAVAQEGARSHGLLNVTAADFLDLDIVLPSVKRQAEIAQILDCASQEITLLTEQLEALRKQKRGLMQSLLTGKLRVRV